MTRVRWVRSGLLRFVASVCVVLSSQAGAAPAGAAPNAAAAAPAVTRIGVRAAPATVHVGSAVVVSGSVTPRVAGVPVVLQRLVGSRWVSLRSTPVSATGTFSVSLGATAPTATWQLRVARVAAKSARAGASATIPVRVTTAIFVVRAAATPATVPATSQAVVTGSVTPRAAGTVVLQSLQGQTWNNVTTGRLTSASTYRLSVVLPAGGYRLRVARPFTASVAGGASPIVTVTVTPPVKPPPPPLTVTSTVLPRGVTGRSYRAMLTATGGSGPYAWTVNGSLPGGLALTREGRLWGYPTAFGLSTVQVVARTAAGSIGAANLTITIKSAPSGTVWAWGDNENGQLGNGTYSIGEIGRTSVPMAVKGLMRVTTLAAAGETAYALLSDGTVWSWGAGTVGQLGNGKPYTYPNAGLIKGLTEVTAIATTGGTGYALRADGTVWAWGDNSEGQLGNGTVTKASYSPGQVSVLTGIVAIAAGGFSGYALKADGTVWSWGDNRYLQLGVGPTPAKALLPMQVGGLSGATAIAGGWFGAYALRADGTVRSWGTNNFGQLGTGTTASSGVPVPVSGLTDATAIAAGSYDGYALRADGTVQAWGDNGNAQIGNGTTTPAPVPVQVSGLTGVTAIAGGSSACYSIGTDRTAQAWGKNVNGELGSGSFTPASLVPVKVTGLANVIAVAGGSFSGYALTQVVEVI